MDRFVIKSGGKKPDEAETSQNKRKSKVDRDRDYDKKRKRSFQDKWLSEFTWLNSDDKDLVFCKICREYPSIADKTSTLFTGKKVERKDTLVAHAQSAKHILCMSKHESKGGKKVGSLDKAFAKVEQSEVERYKKLINTAYAVAKHNRPFTEFEFLCSVQEKNGVNLGTDHRGRDACVEFVKSISSVLLNDVATHLKKVRFFSIMSDSSTDSSVIDQEGILVRYLNPDTSEPHTAIASIENLENAKADGVVAAIKNGMSKCGIDLDNLADSDLKLVCINLDGAAVNLGAKNGVAKKLSDCVNNKVLVTHCVAHRLELGVLDAVKDVGYLKKFEDTIKRICKFYSFSPKRRSELQNLASILDETLLMHSEIKAIRWVSSKSRALKAVSQDLHVTVTHMEQIISTSNRADELGQAKAILSDLKQVKFIKYLYLMMDVLSAITATSTLFQTKDLLIFELKEAIDTLYIRLHAMTKDPGENLTKFYSLFDSESHTFDSYLKLTGTLAEFSEDRDIHGLLIKMSQYILDRFSDLDKSPVSDMRVFDFRLWPPTLTELSTYGNSEIKSLCQHYSDILTEDEVKQAPEQWQKLKVQVSMQRQYHPLGVYSSLLQRNEESLKQINVLLMLLMTVSPSTASCERVFSNMNLVKSSLRSRLTQANLQNQMRIIVNGKDLKDFDPVPAVEFWLASGNRHMTHKKPVKPAVPTAEEPGTSAEADMDTIQPLLTEMVKILGGEDAARAKLKNLSDSGSLSDTGKNDPACCVM